MVQHGKVSITAKTGGAIFAQGSVHWIAGLLPNQSKECVMETLGVSSNTWLKVKRGEPIRLSVAKHLAERLNRLTLPAKY